MDYADYSRFLRAANGLQVFHRRIVGVFVPVTRAIVSMANSAGYDDPDPSPVEIYAKAPGQFALMNYAIVLEYSQM